VKSRPDDISVHRYTVEMRAWILLIALCFSFSTLAKSHKKKQDFFPFFLSKTKTYGSLRKTISESSLSQEEKELLLQSIANIPESQRLPKMKTEDGVFLFSNGKKVTRLDPINIQQGLFKVNGKMVLLNSDRWTVSEAAVEKSISPANPAHAAIVTMFASWYACEKESCENPWMNNLSSTLRAQYDGRKTDRRPASQ
jgi:hypothetical protein